MPVIPGGFPEYTLPLLSGENGGEALVYEGKRSSPGSGRRGKKTEGRTGARLVACLWILFLAAMFKVMFPDSAGRASGAVLRLIGGDVDYAAAVQTLGQAFSGDKGFFQAMAEAWDYAFRIESEDTEVFVDSDIDESQLFFNDPEPVTEAQETWETTGSDAAQDTEMAPDGEQAEPQPQIPEDTEDKVAAFRESQAGYSELGLPSNVSDEMPVLAVTGVRPVEGEVTSGFGYRAHPGDGQVRFHYGIDLGAGEGTDITAFAPGTVTAVGDSSSYGQYVMVEHSDGLVTLYAHMSSISVTGGQQVDASTVVGTVGSTGNATGPCLHFEMILNGIYLNPEYYI